MSPFAPRHFLSRQTCWRTQTQRGTLVLLPRLHLREYKYCHCHTTNENQWGISQIAELRLLFYYKKKRHLFTEHRYLHLGECPYNMVVAWYVDIQVFDWTILHWSCSLYALVNDVEAFLPWGVGGVGGCAVRCISQFVGESVFESHLLLFLL